MAKVVGRNGLVRVGSNTVASVVGFSIDEAMSPIDDTELADTAMTYEAGDTSWTAQIECQWDKADTSGQGAMTIGASISLSVQREGNTSGDETLTGTALITGRSSSNAKGAMVTQSFTLQGSGALTVGAVA